MTSAEKEKGENYHSHLSELYLTTIIFNFIIEIFVPIAILCILAS